MRDDISKCYLWSNFGAATPIVVPLAGFKAYKIRSHHKKLKAIRCELN